MDEQTSRRVPRPIIQALDASVRDIADGNIFDAKSVQAEARRMLADHERAPSTEAGSRPTKRTRTA